LGALGRFGPASASSKKAAEATRMILEEKSMTRMAARHGVVSERDEERV
jgi:hypothetical protein